MTSPAPPDFAPARVDCRRRPDGALLLTSPDPLRPYARAVGDWLERWAAEAPARVFLSERTEAGPRSVTYGEARATVRSYAEALLDLGLSERRPLALLSDNDVDHALLQLAAMHAAVPVAPISPAYSLQSKDLAKLGAIVDRVDPGAVFAADAALFARALDRARRRGAHVLSRAAAPGAIPLRDLARAAPTGRVDAAFAAIGPDTIAKILFTSGSTGTPRGVLNTHRMLCSNQQAILQLWPFLARTPPVVVDWLPWSHTFGGNHNFLMVLSNGGTLHIDRGKPTPQLVERTVELLREVSPTLYFNVPKGFDALLPYLEAEPALRAVFFARLDLIFYAAAALPQSLWARLARVAALERGAPVPLVSAWGSTETSPLVTQVHFPLERAGNIGLPAPGCELLLAPVDDRLELRVRGPNVTPGYLGEGPLAPPSLDAEGFFRMGDAGKLADLDDPARGVLFDGRLSENFKLSSGTWVAVGELRVNVVAACSPLVQDAVIAGQDGERIGLLLIVSATGAASLSSELAALPTAELAREPRLLARLASALAAYNKGASASSQRVARALVLDDPPSIDAGEITDKGYLNQRALLERRADRVAQLFAEPPGEAVIAL